MRTQARTLATIALGVAAFTLLPVIVPHAADAFAQTSGSSSSSTVFTGLQSKATDLFYNARTIILIISALAIVGTMATAVTGRFPVTKAFTLVAAIVVIGLASEIVTYFAGAPPTTSASSTIPTSSMQDTAGSY